MRIGVVHSFYNSDVPSGENVTVAAQVDALRAAGHEVALVAQYSDVRRRRRTWPLEAALTTITGIGPEPTRAAARFRPDVLHVHNLFPNFGTRWLATWPGPLVATMHNFRPMCAVGTFVRNGQRCTECMDGAPFSGVRHACFRGSRIATVPLNWANRRGPAHDAVVRRANQLIAISHRAVHEYTERGVPPERFAVVPNFVPDRPKISTRSGPTSGQRWLFVGRLAREKGLLELMRAWPTGRPLDVIGDGESAAEFRAAAGPDLRFLGAKPNDEVRDVLPSYTGLIVPSQWPEAGPPLTYMEALAAGTPVLAFAGNGAADDVAEAGTGVVTPTIPTRHELTRGLDHLAAARADLSAACRKAYEARFTAPSWVRRMTDVYRSVLADPAGSTSH